MQCYTSSPPYKGSLARQYVPKIEGYMWLARLMCIYGAIIICISLIEIPYSRSNIHQDYCVVAFRIVHEPGTLAKAVKTFAVSID